MTEQEARWSEYVARLREEGAEPFERQWERFAEIYAERSAEEGPPPAWMPDDARVAASNVGRMMRDLGCSGYGELHRWSVAEREQFWSEVIRRLEIVFARRPDAILDPAGGPEDPCWLPGAALNAQDSCFRARPGQPAILSAREGSTEIRRTSYAELERLVRSIGHGLKREGLGEGDGVALYMPLTVECVAAYLAVVRIGGYVVSIADSFSAAEVARRLRLGEAKAIVTVDRFVRGGRSIPLYEKVREAEGPRAFVLPEGDRPVESLRKGDLAFPDLLGPDAPLASSAGDPYRVSNVLFSSGTTGDPKAIPWTHLTPIKCAMDGHLHQDIHPGDVVAWPTNIGWMMGPWLIYATLLNRATMALHEGRPGERDFTRFVADAGVTMLGVVPSLVRAWRAADAVAFDEWPRIRAFSSTGEPSARQDYLWLMSRAGYRAPVIEYLGGTEIGGGHITGTVVQPASPATFATPALGIDFVILDPRGNRVREGESGELFLIPPSVGLSQSLLNRDHHEVYYAGCPKGPDGALLRRHGDEFLRLHRGYYKTTGRADDTMNLGGIKVSSIELEQAVEGHEAVYECAAIGVQPEGEGAEQLVLYVVPRDERDPETLRKELSRRIGARLNPLFRVHQVVLVNSLPRTASNKLMRRELRAQWKR